MDEPLERCLRDVVADFQRQGGLAMGDVYRLLESHRLSAEDATAVLTRLEQLDIKIDDADDLEDDVPSVTGGGRLSSHRILTAPEEVSLGRRIRLGLQTEASLGDREPSRAEAALIRDGRGAHQIFVRSNVRLAISIAKRYVGQGLEMDDLVQEGVLGLMRAADKFDHTLGYKFSTYATWWVRQSIERAIANSSRTIRLPVHIVEQIDRVTTTKRRMETALGREPTLVELGFELQMDAAKLAAMLDHAQGVVSLDWIVGEDASLGDLQASRGVTPHLSVEQHVLREDVDSRLQTLGFVMGERSEDVLRRRFGFERDGEAQTLEEIGKVYGVTRERIRQIESKALKSDYVRELFSDLNGGWFSSEAD